MVLRALCQVGLMFLGRIFLRGLNPIQQHLFHVIDQTALTVWRIIWELCSQLRKCGYRLTNLCLLVLAEELACFVCLPGEEGNVLPNKKAIPILLQKHNYSWKSESLVNQKDLVDWMHGLSLEQTCN